MQQPQHSTPPKGNSGQHDPRQGPSEEEVIEVGSLAAQALNNPVWEMAYNTLNARYYQQWMTQPPDHTKSIMHLHTKTQVLRELYQELATAAEHAKMLLERRQQNQSADVKESQRLDSLGFSQ